LETEDDGTIPGYTYNFVQISELPNWIDKHVDIAALVLSDGDVTELTSKAGKELKKKNVILYDNSMHAIGMTLWGDDTAMQFQVGSVMILAGVEVKEYNGIGINKRNGSDVIHEPVHIAEVAALKKWGQSAGMLLPQLTHLTKSNLRGNEKPMYSTLNAIMVALRGWNEETSLGVFNIRGRFVHIKQDGCSYSACSNPQACNKRVELNEDELYICPKCEYQTSTCNQRYILKTKFQDTTGHIWVTLFDETAQSLLGVSANELTGLEKHLAGELLFGSKSS
jgi:replication factor A1